MANIITTQPNGKFAIWSTVVDAFILGEASYEDLEQFFVDRAIEQAKQDLQNNFTRHTDAIRREKYLSYRDRGEIAEW